MRKAVMKIGGVAALCAFALALVPVGQAPESEQTIKFELGGMQIAETTEESSAILLSNYKLSQEEYEGYGVSPKADSSEVITATVKDDNTASNTAVEWTFRWNESADNYAWSKGKDVNEYLEIITRGTNVSDSKVATVICWKPFGTQILLTVSAKEKPSVKKDVTVEYLAKIENVSLSFGSVKCNFENEKTSVPLTLKQGGEMLGGLPKFEYTTADDTCTISSNYDIYFGWDWNNSKSKLFMQSGIREKDQISYFSFGALGNLEEGEFDTMIKGKGLYFGIEYFVENLQFLYFYGRTVSVFAYDVYYTLNYQQLAERFSQSILPEQLFTINYEIRNADSLVQSGNLYFETEEEYTTTKITAVDTDKDKIYL